MSSHTLARELTVVLLLKLLLLAALWFAFFRGPSPGAATLEQRLFGPAVPSAQQDPQRNHE